MAGETRENDESGRKVLWFRIPNHTTTTTTKAPGVVLTFKVLRGEEPPHSARPDQDGRLGFLDNGEEVGALHFRVLPRKGLDKVRDLVTFPSLCDQAVHVKNPEPPVSLLVAQTVLHHRLGQELDDAPGENENENQVNKCVCV